MKNQSQVSGSSAGIGLLVAIGILVISLIFHLLFAVGNFLIVEQAFLAQNWEQVPVGTLPFVGPFFTAFELSEATVSQVFAAGLVGVINVVFWFLAGLLVGILRAGFDVHAAREELADSDAGSSAERLALSRRREAKTRLVRNAVWCLILIPIAYFMVQWDISQFRMRWELNVLNQANATDLLGADSNSGERLGEYLNGMLAVSAIGYIACMFGACVASHFALDQVAQKWEALMSSVRTTWEDQVGSDSSAGRQSVVVGDRTVNVRTIGDDEPLPEASYADEVPYAPEPANHSAEFEDERRIG